jgi:hypothetical protein
LWSFVVGAALCAAAAVMLALLPGGSGDEAQIGLAVSAPVAAPAAVADPALQPMIEPPATAEPPPAAAPIAPPVGAFTVHVRPLTNPENLEAGVALALKFRDRLMAQLQAVPNLVLVDPADGNNGAVDYEVRLRLESPPGIAREMLGEMAPAMHMVLVDAGPPARFAAADARLAAEAQLSPADRQRNQRARQLMRANAIVRNGLPMSVSLLDTAAMPSPSGGDPVELRAKEVTRMLRNEAFPVDDAYLQSTLATVGNRAEPFNVRSLALSDLLRIGRRDGYASLDAEVIRAGADLAFSEPGNLLRTVVWENMLATRHPELIPQIARALDIEPDTNLRLRLIKFLASDLAGNPDARGVLEVAARGNGQTVVRMAALREVQGDANWHAYVAASLVDTSLPDRQRLQAIADMADPASTQATARLALDDKALRELIALADRGAADPENGMRAFNAILALRFVDSPALAERLIEIVRAPVNVQTSLTSNNSRGFKTAAIGVASERFPDDPRFRAVLEELAAASDAQLSAWAKDELELMEAMTDPGSRKAYFEKLLQKIAPASPAPP